MEGKGLLLEAVRMLVAWQRSLTEEESSKSAGAVLVHVLVHAGLSSGIDSGVCYYNLRRDIQVSAGGDLRVRVRVRVRKCTMSRKVEAENMDVRI